MSPVEGDFEVWVEFGSAADPATLAARIEQQRRGAAADAAELQKRLSSRGFTNRADPAIVRETRERLAAFSAREERLAALTSNLTSKLTSKIASKTAGNGSVPEGGSQDGTRRPGDRPGRPGNASPRSRPGRNGGSWASNPAPKIASKTAESRGAPEGGG